MKGVLHLRAILQAVFMNPTPNMFSGVTLLKLLPHLSGASESITDVTHRTVVGSFLRHNQIKYHPNAAALLKTFFHHAWDVIKSKHFPRYWPFVRDIHRSPVNYPHKGQWRGAFMFSLTFARINGWVNNREAGDLRRHRGHYDITVMV